MNMFIIITVEIGQFVNTKGDRLHRLQEWRLTHTMVIIQTNLLHEFFIFFGSVKTNPSKEKTSNRMSGD